MTYQEIIKKLIAMDTIKLVRKLGYDLMKRKD